MQRRVGMSLLQGKILDVVRVINAYQKAKNLVQEDTVILIRRMLVQRILSRVVMNHMDRQVTMVILISSIMDGAILAEEQDLVLDFNKREQRRIE